MSKKKMVFLRTQRFNKHTVGDLLVFHEGEIIFQCKAFNMTTIAPDTYDLGIKRSKELKMNLWCFKDLSLEEGSINVESNVVENKGLIAVGKGPSIDSSGKEMVTYSQNTLTKLHFAMAGEKETTLTIIDVYDMD